jgi:hypothetical protein
MGLHQIIPRFSYRSGAGSWTDKRASHHFELLATDRNHREANQTSELLALRLSGDLSLSLGFHCEIW